METENKPAEAEIIQTENKTTTPATPAATETETPEQINWKKFREAREVERKQKIEAEKRASEKEAEAQALKAAMEAILNKPQAAPQSYEQEARELTDAERIRLEVEKAIADRDKKYEAERIAKEQANLPRMLQSNFQDFNQVCSEDNIDYLEYHYPEVAEAFRHMPDGFDKWANIYKAVKRFVPNTNSQKDQARAEKNFSKPQAMSIAGKTQVGDSAPVQLDEKRRQDNWQRMQRVMKGGT